MIPSLLLISSRLSMSPENSSRLERLIAAGLNWNDLLERASTEGTGPLLYRNLGRLKTGIPPLAWKKLEWMYFGNVARNIRLFHELKPLLQAIHEKGLKAAVTKGARLIETVYRDIGLRPFTDVDFFVCPSDWPELENILEEQGFSRTELRDPTRKAGVKNAEWVFAPNYRKSNLVVEMHFNDLGLHHPLSRPVREDIWKSTEIIHLGETPARVLSSEHELCYACLHAQQHSYSRLMWMTDIAELSLQDGLDWDKVYWICREEGITAPIFYGLYLTDYLWPGTVPKSILRSLKPAPLELRLLKFFWPESKVASRDTPLIFPYYTPTFFSLLSKKKLFTAAKTLFSVYFPPQQWVLHRYGIPKNSTGMMIHYFWRLSRPLVLITRRFFRAE